VISSCLGNFFISVGMVASCETKASNFFTQTYETVDQSHPFCFLFLQIIFSIFSTLIFFYIIYNFLIKFLHIQVSLSSHHSLYFSVLFTKIEVPGSSLHINHVNSTLGTTSIYPIFNTFFLFHPLSSLHFYNSLYISSP